MTDQHDVDPQQRYESVLATVDHQTSPQQRPGVRPRTVYLCCVAHGSYSRSGVKSSLQAALDNGDIIAYRDSDGQLRFCLREPAAVERLVDEHPGAAEHDAVATILGAADE